MTPVVVVGAVLMAAVVSFGASDFQVNQHTTYDQKDPAVALLTPERFVVAWSSYRQEGSSTAYSNGVYMRIYDVNAAPVTDELPVNQTVIGNQKLPAVAADGQGQFVVVWQGPDAASQDDSHIFARLFDTSGQALTDEFRVSTAALGADEPPRLAMNGAGEMVVVWTSVTVQDRRAVYVRVYDGAGLPIGDEFGVDDSTYDCRFPDVAMDEVGRFAVTWTQDRSADTVWARFLNVQGSALSDGFEVSEARSYSLPHSCAAMNGQGDLVVAWDGRAEQGAQDDIYVRIYDPNGDAVGAAFIANSLTQQAQEYPRVSMSPDGGFIIVWHSDTGDVSWGLDAFARRFDSAGRPVCPEFRLNSHREDDQKDVVVTATAKGGFVAIWESEGQDGSRSGVFGQACMRCVGGDMTCDCAVNFFDFGLFGQQYGQAGVLSEADLTGDARVDALDLKLLCEQWLRE